MRKRLDNRNHKNVIKELYIYTRDIVFYRRILRTITANRSGVPNSGLIWRILAGARMGLCPKTEHLKSPSDIHRTRKIDLSYFPVVAYHD